MSPIKQIAIQRKAESLRRFREEGALNWSLKDFDNDSLDLVRRSVGMEPAWLPPGVRGWLAISVYFKLCLEVGVGIQVGRVGVHTGKGDPGSSGCVLRTLGWGTKTNVGGTCGKQIGEVEPANRQAERCATIWLKIQLPLESPSWVGKIKLNWICDFRRTSEWKFSFSQHSTCFMPGTV